MCLLAVLTTVVCSVRADPPAAVASLTIVGLEQFIQSNHIASIEQLLPALPASYLRHYTLVFQSRSLQDASYANPRVLVYGSNARLIMTFNGEPSQTGFNALELLEFNELTQSFQMAEIQFGDAAVDKQVRWSELNPPKCLQCHGASPRPLWDAPPLWPGSYGEAYHERLSHHEADGLYSYLKQQASHPRYRWLTNVQPYQSDTTFYPSQHDVYEGIETESPNAQLTKLLTGLNSEKILHQVMEHPRFHLFRYALLASLSPSCNALADDVPSAWRSTIEADYNVFAQQDADNLQRQLTRKAQRSASGRGAQDSVSSDNSLRNFRYLAERGLGLDTSEWSMALEKNSPDFTALTPIKPAWEQRLISQVSKDDKNILGQYYYRNYPDHNRYCRYLEAQSQQQLAGAQLQLPTKSLAAPEASSAASDGSARHTLQLCAACHTTGAAPHIDFDNPTRLAQKLNQPYSTRGTLLNTLQYRLSTGAGAHRMPPNINLPDSDIASLRNYLDKLADHQDPSRPLE